MSADNWALCPKCKKNDITKLIARQRKVADSYGRIPADLYEADVIGLKNWPKLEHTLREDYEQGIDEDGEYTCSFRAACNVCHFSFTFSTKIEPETVFNRGKV